MTNELILVLLFTFIVNLPFGWWRKGLRKLSFLWFLAIHLPIPLVIALRITLGISYAAIPAVILSAVLGQAVGGKFRKTPA